MVSPFIERLNQQFGIISELGQLHISIDKGGIPVIDVSSQLATARISLQGAHLLSWGPAGEEAVIWLSQDARFEKGKSVRGGIPICWPWFGANSNNIGWPAHGFARTVLWELIDTQLLESGEMQLCFCLDTEQQDEIIRQMWPQATRVTYILTIGQRLRLELSTQNNSEEEITIGEALHTYFNVGDIRNTRLVGLNGKAYLDKPDGFRRKTQNGDISFKNEVDRVYINTTDDLVIDNSKREILITKQGSASTVVWNPWEAVATVMGDLGKNGYLEMLCVESANAAENTVKITPGGSHTLRIEYSVAS